MTDPNNATQPTDDPQRSSRYDEQHVIDELDVRSEDAEKVKGGQLEDPCAGGRIVKRA